MKCFTGIDLGSTTTKAVVLNERQEIMGRGITNSRSNYDVACAVARSEAFADVRFALSSRALADTRLPADRREPFLATLERSYRLALHLKHLELLRKEMLEVLPGVAAFFPGAELKPAVTEVLDQMEETAADLFAPGAQRKSDFFRDIAGSQYHRLAEKRVLSGKRPFEALMGVFDKAILQVENQQVELPYEKGAGWAIERTLDQENIADAGMRREIADLLSQAFSVELEEKGAVGTGYGRARLPFARENIRSEILCHGLGAHRMFPNTATVLDIGGQDTKAIQVDNQGIVTSFQMNDRCAAGCGRYLGYIADEMSLGLHELGPLAQKSTRRVKISSTCTVFAGAEIRDRLTLGQKREDILAGLHRSVMLRALSLIARSGGARDEFTFTGGVAKNVMAVRVLRELLDSNYGHLTINFSADSIYTGALGAALFAFRGAA